MSDRAFDLLVFDWDGTLMDSEYRIVGCLRAASLGLGLAPLADARYRHVIGLGLIEACAMLYPQAGAVVHAQLAEAYKHEFLSRDPAGMQLFDGAAAVLETLAARGYRLAVATGKSRAGLQRAFHDTGLGRLFEASRCADETASKPDPCMLYELLDETGVPAARTLMIGDTGFDLEMARNAGVGGIAATWGCHAPAQLLCHAPLACLDDITGLPALLDALSAAAA